MSIATIPTYLTADEFRALTRVSEQKDPGQVTDDQINDQIIFAETQIDAYIGWVEPYNKDICQPRKFPTLDCNNCSYIPDEIKYACAEIVSNLLLIGEPTEGYTGQSIKREAWSATGYSVEKTGSNTGGIEESKINLNFPNTALQILKKWKNNTSPLTY